MGEPLTAERRAQLDAAVNAGDRRTYYTLLGQWGYKYGDLAKDVAFGDRINGAVANQYARQVAQSRGVKLTESQWKSFSIDLMRADWGMRQRRRNSPNWRRRPPVCRPRARPRSPMFVPPKRR